VPGDTRRPARRAGELGSTLAALTRSRLFRLGFVVAALVAAGVAVLAEREAVADTVSRTSPAVLALAAAGVVVHLVTAALAWRAVLADGGWRLDVRGAVRVFLVGQLGKYLPGGVWNVVTQAELAADRGVPRVWTVGASAVALGISVGVGALLAVPALVAVSVPAVPVAVVLLVPVGLVLFHPRLLNPLLRRGAALVRRPAPRPLSMRGIAATLGWTLLSWLALFGHVLLLLLGVGAPLGPTTVLAATSGFAFAWIAGFVLLLAPAGVGVREVTLVAVLLSVVSRPEALVVALGSRLVMTAMDVATALLALLALPGARQRTTARTGGTGEGDAGDDVINGRPARARRSRPAPGALAARALRPRRPRGSGPPP
jgi:hypothetical protein